MLTSLDKTDILRQVKGDSKLLVKIDGECSLLHVWAARDDPSFLKELLEIAKNNKLSVDVKSKFDRTPLHYAVIAAQPENVTLLLNYNASPVVQEFKEGFSPLHFACANYTKSHIDCAIRILNHEKTVPLVPNLLDFRGRSPLHFAAQSASPDLVALLLELGADSNVRDPGRGLPSPLHYAAESGSLECTKLLICHGANMTAVTKQGIIPLHIAAFRKQYDVIKLFLQHKVPVDYRTPISGTALYYAASANNKKVVRILENEGADVAKRCVNGVAPIHIAVEKGHLDMVQLLVELGANITVQDNFGRTPLHIAAQLGKMDILEYLLRKGPHTVMYITKGGSTAMELAAYAKLNDIKARLSKDMWLRSNWVSAAGMGHLHIAACCGDSAINTFIEMDGNSKNRADEQGRTPLHWAISAGNEEVVKSLLDANANILTRTKQGETSFHLACRKGLYNTVEKILKEDKECGRNICPDVRSELSGESALHCACSSGHKDILEILLKYGAQINAQDNAGNTGLHKALAGGHINCAEFLISKGAATNITNSYKETVLHAAVFGCQNINFVDQQMLRSVNAVSSNGSAPLHIGAMLGYESTVKYLLDKGADPFLPNSNGYSALECAVLSGSEGTLEVLLEKTKGKPGGEEELHHACRTGSVRCLYMLLKCENGNRFGPFVNTPDKEGNSPLHLAVIEGNVACVQVLLLDGRVDVNATNDAEKTARELCGNTTRGKQCALLIDSINTPAKP